MFKPKISVIMLTYNRDKLVSKAIDSILAQTFADFEYIIVDNGSTDRSGAIADDYASRDGRIRVIHRERGNIGSGRNTGLDAACGEYITFIDDDDWCEPDFLEFLYELAIENNADVAICGTTDRVFDEKILMSAEDSLIELMWRRKYNMGFPTKLFQHTLATVVRFPELDQYDDISQMHRLLASANCVAYHGLPKYTILRHEGNNSSWTTNHSLLTPLILDEYLSAYRNRTEWLSHLFPDSVDVWQYFEWSFMISMVEKIKRLDIRGCEEHLEQMKSVLSACSDIFYNSDYILDFEKYWMRLYLRDHVSMSL